MHLLLNGFSLVRPLTGIGQYTHHLANELDKHGLVENILYWGAVSVGDRQFLDNQLKIISKPASRSVRKLQLLSTFRLNAFINHLTLKSGNLKNHIYHETNYVARPYHGKLVTTVHDLSFIHYPELHPPERIAHMKHLTETLERSAHVITDSDYVRNEVIEHYKIEPERISTVPLGVDSNFNPASDEEKEEFKLRYGIKSNFIFMVGSIEPRKQIDKVINAYISLPENIKKEYVLVHAGPAGWNNSSISDQFDKLTATGELIALGYIDEADLATLYSAATCLVYPSIYEGFGLPILEAMASGTPVITSNLSSMPEVGGQAAMLIDPSNQEQLRNALIEVLQDLDLRERLTTAGIQHARLYRWQTCAQATAEIYKRVY